MRWGGGEAGGSTCKGGWTKWKRRICEEENEKRPPEEGR